MKWIVEYSGETKQGKNLTDELGYTYIQNDDSLDHIREYLGKKCPYFTHAIVKINNGDYEEIWITDTNQYWISYTWYEKLTFGLVEDYKGWVYRVTTGIPGYLPNNYEDFTNLDNAKQYIKDWVKEALNSEENYYDYEQYPALWHKWEYLSYLKRSDLIKIGQTGLTVGILVDGQGYDNFVTIAYVPESL